MNYVALKMLLGDRAKYLGLIFSIGFSAFLIAHQASIFCGLMARTASQIRDITDASLWVMDPKTEYVDEISGLHPHALYHVRSTPGIEWAVPLFKGLPLARAEGGRFRSVILLGVDDDSLVGIPRKLLIGSKQALRGPDAVLIDAAGYRSFFPDAPLEVGRTVEINDRRAQIVGICEASHPFQTFPVLYTRYSRAVGFAGRDRNPLSFILAKPKNGVTDAEAAANIERVTHLKALPSGGFAWQTIQYYLHNTGIPANFGITVFVAVLVGSVVAGQTFYLFTLENLKQFAALKAIGVTDSRIVGMILLQAVWIGLIGFSFGIAACAAFFELTQHKEHLRGFILIWQIAAITAAMVMCIIFAASFMSIRRVLREEPAIVFRS